MGDESMMKKNLDIQLYTEHMTDVNGSTLLG